MNNLVQEAPSEVTEHHSLYDRWIFIARAISIYLIVWLHTDIEPGFVSTIVQGGTGIFFLIAGYGLPTSAKKAGLFALISARTWLIWTTIAGLLYMGLKGSFEWESAIGWHTAAYNYPLWYLRTIISYELILAVLIGVHLLPKHGVLLMIALAGMAYFTEWSDLTRLNFSWFVMMFIGYNLKEIGLERIYNYLDRHLIIIGITSLIVIFEGQLVTTLAAEYGWKYTAPNTCITCLSYCILYLLASILIGRHVPKLSHYIARIGSCSMFIFVSHAILIGIIHLIQQSMGGCVQLISEWTPILTLIGLSVICLTLQKRWPRFMAFIGCPPSPK